MSVTTYCGGESLYRFFSATASGRDSARGSSSSLKMRCVHIYLLIKDLLTTLADLFVCVWIAAEYKMNMEENIADTYFPDLFSRFCAQISICGKLQKLPWSFLHGVHCLPDINYFHLMSIENILYITGDKQLMKIFKGVFRVSIVVTRKFYRSTYFSILSGLLRILEKALKA